MKKWKNEEMEKNGKIGKSKKKGKMEKMEKSVDGNRVLWQLVGSHHG